MKKRLNAHDCTDLLFSIEIKMVQAEKLWFRQLNIKK